MPFTIIIDLVKGIFLYISWFEVGQFSPWIHEKLRFWCFMYSKGKNIKLQIKKKSFIKLCLKHINGKGHNKEYFVVMYTS